MDRGRGDGICFEELEKKGSSGDRRDAAQRGPGIGNGLVSECGGRRSSSGMGKDNMEKVGSFWWSKKGWGRGKHRGRSVIIRGQAGFASLNLPKLGEKGKVGWLIFFNLAREKGGKGIIQREEAV